MDSKKIVSSINTVGDLALYNEAADNIPSLLTGAVVSLASVNALRKALEFLNQDDSQIHPDFLELCDTLRQESADKTAFLMLYFNDTFTYETLKTISKEAIVACLKLFNDWGVSSQLFLEKFSESIEQGVQAEKDSATVERISETLNDLMGETVVQENNFLLENTKRSVLAAQASINDKKSKKNTEAATAAFEARQAEEKAALVDGLAKLLLEKDIFLANGNMPRHLAGVYLSSMAFSKCVLAQPDFLNESTTAQEILSQLDLLSLRKIEAAARFIKDRLPHNYALDVEGWSVSLYKKDSEGSTRYPVLSKHPRLRFMLPSFVVPQRAHRSEDHANTIQQCLPNFIWRKIESLELSGLIEEDDGAGPSEVRTEASPEGDRKGKRPASSRTTVAPSNKNKLHGIESTTTYSLMVTLNDGIEESEHLVDFAVVGNQKYDNRPPKTVLTEENASVNKICENLVALGCLVEHKAMSNKHPQFKLLITPKAIPNLTLDTAKKIKKDLQTAKDTLKAGEANKTLLKRGVLSFFKTALFKQLMTTLENKIDQLEAAEFKEKNENDTKISQSKDAVIAHIMYGAELDATNKKWQERPENIMLIKNTIKTMLLDAIRKNNETLFNRVLAFYKHNVAIFGKEALPDIGSLSRWVTTRLSEILNGHVAGAIISNDLICQLLRIYTEKKILTRDQLKTGLAEPLYQHVERNILSIGETAEKSAYLQSVKVLWELVGSTSPNQPQKLFIRLKQSLRETGRNYTSTENVIFCIKLFFPDNNVVSKLSEKLKNDIEDAGNNRLPRTWLLNAAPEAVVNYLHDEFACDKPWPTWIIALGSIGFVLVLVAAIASINQNKGGNKVLMRSGDERRSRDRVPVDAIRSEPRLLNGFAEVTIDGVKYKGLFLDNDFIKGERWFENGAYQNGEFENGNLQKGFFRNNVGAIMDGVFEDNHIKEGKAIFKKGLLMNGRDRTTETVEMNGQFDWDGLVSGSLEIKEKKTTKKGEFKNGMLHGQGEEYVDGKLVRRGLYEFDAFVKGEEYGDSDLKSGTFKNGRLNGEGEIYMTSGGYHIGLFRDGVPQGWGVRKVSGLRFVGHYENGIEREGMFEYEEGMRIEGVFKNTVGSGKGMIAYPDGRIFNGLFEGGRPTKGYITNKDGEIFRGRFSNGILEGPGTWTLKNGTVKVVKFEKGVVVS